MRTLTRLIALEPLIWICLVQWAVLRRRPRAHEFTYHRESSFGILLIAALFSAPVEILLSELLIPWAWLRWGLLVLEVYATIWLVGLYASLVVRPYRLDNDGLRLRYGLLADGFVAYQNMLSVAREQRPAPKGRDGLQVSKFKDAAYLATGGKTEVVLRLSEPVVVRGLLSDTPSVRVIRLAADDPNALVAALRERTMAAAGALGTASR